MRRSIERNLRVLEQRISLGLDAISRQERRLIHLKQVGHKDVIATAQEMLIRLLRDLETSNDEHTADTIRLRRAMAFEMMKLLYARGEMLCKCAVSQLPNILNANDITPQCAINYIRLYQEWDDYLQTEKWHGGDPAVTAEGALTLIDQWRHEQPTP